MCGILGTNFINKNFVEALKLLQNRGPDYFNFKQFHTIMLGHTRLKIVDLDDEANQPMIFDNIVIVFNGEIYNYKELIKEYNLNVTTKSDTEVIIRLYQQYNTTFLNFLNGAFSFCIYDIKKDKFFCARDRYGKKPFFYYHKNNLFIFSSMIKPIIKLLGSTPQLNKVALSQYLQYFTPLEPNTFYKDILKLPKATYLLFENNKLILKKYYKIKTYKTIKENNLAINRIENILIDSIEKRIKCDVDVGVLLSGGIDSSLLSAIYSKITNKKINTFSIGYKTYQKYSELPYATLMAKNINANHTAIELDQKTFIDSLENTFEALEEPHADPAAIPLYYLCKTIKKQGIKAVLSGEGSDELFLGYDNYKKFLKYYNFKKSLQYNQQEFLNDIIGALQTNTKESEYLRRVIKNETIYNSFGEIFTHIQRKKLLKKVATFKNEKEKKDPIDWMSYIDLHIWLGEALLSKVDKILMSNSIENRNPFLDYNLVDTIFTTDNTLKIGKTNKYLLKQIAIKYIPKEIITRQKKGFNSPFNEWLFNEYNNKLLEDILYVNNQTNLFNQNYIEFLYNEAKQNRFKQHFYALWQFCIWYKKTYIN